MAFCIKCGKQIPEIAKFCLECGAIQTDDKIELGQKKSSNKDRIGNKIKNLFNKTKTAGEKIFVSSIFISACMLFAVLNFIVLPLILIIPKLAVFIGNFGVVGFIKDPSLRFVVIFATTFATILIKVIGKLIPLPGRSKLEDLAIIFTWCFIAGIGGIILINIFLIIGLGLKIKFKLRDLISAKIAGIGSILTSVFIFIISLMQNLPNFWLVAFPFIILGTLVILSDYIDFSTLKKYTNENKSDGK